MGVASTLWRKVWAVLALIVALNVVYQAGPGHADSQDFSLASNHAAVAFEEHHPGDGDGGHHGQVGGGHCAGHCGGHVAKDAPPPSAVVLAIPRVAIVYDLRPDRLPDSALPQQLIRPPSA